MARSKKPEAIEKIEEESVRGKVRAGWKEAVLLAIFIVLIALVAVFFLVQEKSQEVNIIGAAAKAPEFSLPFLDGKLVSLSEYRGKVVMVHFWATWCPPCVEEMPTLESLYRTLKGQDFELLAISVDEGGAGAVTAFMHKKRLNMPVLLDTSGTVAALYGTFKFPETYIVDREGVVRYKEIGSRDWSAPEGMAIVKNIIGMK
jgi:peroxiredoxin